MELLYLICGIVLLVLMIYDFFFTTLSGSGSGFLTWLMLGFTAVLLKVSFKIFGRRFFGLSGMLVNLFVLAMWIILAWAGLFFIYSSDPASILDSKGVVADAFDRMYFTGYTLSTLGNGDLHPVTPAFKLITSIFSFFGFVFFTTSITYLLSVSSSVTHKRKMALTIWTLGATPEEIADSLNTDLKADNFFKLASLENMIHKYTVINHAYPVLHYYHNTSVHNSLGLNLATLDEGLNLLLTKKQSPTTITYIGPLRKALDNFLRFIEDSSRGELHYERNANLPKPSENLQKSYEEELDVEHRRRVLARLLKNEGFTWEDVYYKAH